jgi:hypothetical protein
MNSGDAMMLIVLAGIVMSLFSLRSQYRAWQSYVAHQKSNRLSLQKAYFERAQSGGVVTASLSTHGDRASRPTEQDATGSGTERFLLHKDRICSATPSRMVSSCSLRACTAATHPSMDSVLPTPAGRIFPNPHSGRSRNF